MRDLKHRVLFPYLLVVACAQPPKPPALVAGFKVDPNQACRSILDFRAAAILGTEGEERAVLQRWIPPRPPQGEEREVAHRLLRIYLENCSREPLVDLTRKLVGFRTVSSERPQSDPEFVRMAEFLKGWAEALGLGFRAFGNNDVWEVTLGSGPRHLGFVLHGDVVPVGVGAAALPDGWSSPPFEGKVLPGSDRLYGRGSEDDKGPLASVLLLLSTLRSFGLAPLDQQLVVIIGTGEESDWDGMKSYVAAETLPEHVVSLDASFPVVVAESGFVSWTLAAPVAPPEPGMLTVVSAEGGSFLTQVPGTARMVVGQAAMDGGDDLWRLVEAAVLGARRSRLDSASMQIEARRLEAGKVAVEVTGVAVHSSVADEGHNALWALADVASRLLLARGGAQAMLDVVYRMFDADHFGKRLGLSYEHPLMGALLAAPTLLRMEPQRSTLAINLRRPAGKTSAEFGKLLDAALGLTQQLVDGSISEAERYIGDPYEADISGPLVPALLAAYQSVSGAADAVPISIRGGTYARLFPRAVSFGPSFPGKPYRGHAPDEYVELGDLKKLLQMLAEATLMLTDSE